MQLIQKRVSYIEVQKGWQTYVFDLYCNPIRYKLLTTKTELEIAISNCQKAGWNISNATNLVNKMNQRCK